MANIVKAKLRRLQAEKPAPKVKIRKGDQVLVVSGANRGDTGRVIDVDPRASTARVEGIRIVKKHEKPDRARGKTGGIVRVEAPIQLSNLKVIDPSTGRATRVGRRILEDGTIVRYAKGSGTVLDKTK
ncbi:MAG: 50S ribosomal protein L24 [Acidobacteria bacterium]|nr:50S ribosomal protein L24 [Acidobacteriota bacterium]